MTAATAAAYSPHISSRRVLGAVGLVAGLAWLTLGLESIINKGAETYRDALMLAPWLLSMAVIAGIHGMQRERAGRFERVAAVLLLGALALGVPGQAGNIWEIDALKVVAFVSFLGFVAGTVAFGGATYRAGVVPKPLAVALALTQVGTMAAALAMSPWVPLENEGAFSGTIVHAAVFLSLGAWLWRTSAGSADETFSAARATP